MQILDVHPMDKRDEAKEIFSDMFAGKRDLSPLPFARKDGTLFPVETRVWFGKWDGKDCIFGISKDLSKEQESLQKFNKIFENNPAPMAISAIPERVFTEVNQAFLLKTGYTKEEIIGKTSEQLGLFIQPEKHWGIAD
jgi:PAS domain-containing protein